jgi:hypothetical protein
MKYDEPSLIILKGVIKSKIYLNKKSSVKTHLLK